MFNHPIIVFYKLFFENIISGIIDYNFICFRSAIQQVFELRNKSQYASMTNSAGSPVVNGKIADGQISPTLNDEHN